MNWGTGRNTEKSREKEKERDRSLAGYEIWSCFYPTLSSVFYQHPGLHYFSKNNKTLSLGNFLRRKKRTDWLTLSRGFFYKCPSSPDSIAYYYWDLLPALQTLDSTAVSPKASLRVWQPNSLIFLVSIIYFSLLLSFFSLGRCTKAEQMMIVFRQEKTFLSAVFVKKFQEES